MQRSGVGWGTWWRLELPDIGWLIGLTLLAGTLRFASPIFPDLLQPGAGRLISVWGISHSYEQPVRPAECSPSSIAPCSPFIFDELYFANDARDDLIGRDYLDPEPPLAKLIIAFGIKLFGFTSFGWRVMSAVFGTLLVALMYLLARLLVPVRFFAVATGLLTTFDGMTFVQSRIGMIDIYPIVLIVVAYILFHLHLRSDLVRRQRATIVLTGLALGAALAAKWISLAAYGTIVLILVIQLLRRAIQYDRATAAIATLSLTLLPVSTYLVAYTRYLSIAHSIPLESLPVALTLWPFHLDAGVAWHNLVAFHRWTFTYHYTLHEPHPYYSKWFSWPVLYRPVLYYYTDRGLGVDAGTGTSLVAGIFNLGNPLIWWASIAALLWTGWVAVRRRALSAAFILLAFAAAWLPFALIPRGLFLYHMFGGLPFMILATALALTELRTKARLLAPVLGYLGAVVLSFVFFYPLWTGMPLTSDALRARIWFPTWL